MWFQVWNNAVHYFQFEVSNKSIYKVQREKNHKSRGTLKSCEMRTCELYFESNLDLRQLFQCCSLAYQSVRRLKDIIHWVCEYIFFRSIFTYFINIWKRKIIKPITEQVSIWNSNSQTYKSCVNRFSNVKVRTCICSIHRESSTWTWVSCKQHGYTHTQRQDSP